LAGCWLYSMAHALVGLHGSMGGTPMLPQLLDDVILGLCPQFFHASFARLCVMSGKMPRNTRSEAARFAALGIVVMWQSR
jgi:hypothetical protein